MRTRKIVACASLLAVAGTANNTKATHAASLTDQTKEELRRAICFQDWNKAVEMTSLLMATPTITLEHRQTLVTWRSRFSNYALANTRFNRIPNCQAVEPPVINTKALYQPWSATLPRFSEYAQRLLPEYYCYWITDQGQTINLESVCSNSPSQVIVRLVDLPPLEPLPLPRQLTPLPTLPPAPL
jgi:hypothetical protein